MAYQAKESFFKRHPWALHLLLALGASLAVLALVFMFVRIYARQGQEYELPDVVGQEMSALLADNPIGLDVVVMDSIYRQDEPGGVILTQDPKAGTMVKQGRKLYVTVTAFRPEDAAMPELSGLSVRQAINELASIGLTPGKLTFVESPYGNSVIEQTCKGKIVYAGQQIERGAVVDLTVGRGESPSVVVPFAIGKTAERARRDIMTASLNVGKEHFQGVKNRRTAVVYKQEPDYTGVSRYPYGTSVELWYIDADKTDVQKMVREFKVDSSKIVESPDLDEDIDIYGDGRPTPEEIEENDDWAW